MRASERGVVVETCIFLVSANDTCLNAPTPPISIGYPAVQREVIRRFLACDVAGISG